tara:strand:+ start:130 stop:276 length:147 start_codon:yes stop_codon:yes gene_type:complete
MFLEAFTLSFTSSKVLLLEFTPVSCSLPVLFVGVGSLSFEPEEFKEDN